MSRWAGAFAIAAVAAFVSSASAAAPGSFTFKLPLPKPHQALIYELTASATIPAGTTFTATGSPWVLNATNQPNLPSYIRAAAVTFPTGAGKWLIFIAINAPKGLVHGRRTSSAAGDATLDTNVQATPPLTGWTPTVGLSAYQQVLICRVLEAHEEQAARDKQEKEFFSTLVGGSPTEGKQIVGYAKKADTSCNK